MKKFFPIRFFSFLFSGIMLALSCSCSHGLPGSIPEDQEELIDSVRNPRRNDLAKVVHQTTTLNFYDTEGITPIGYAIIMEDQKKLKILLDAGADPLFPDLQKYTALHLAASQSNLPALQLLLNRGLSPDVKGPEGKTPLMEALRLGNTDAVRLLLTKKPNLKQRDSIGRTSLSFAAMARSNSLDLVKLLLRHGAERAVADDNGWTPFFHAIRSKNTGSALYLLSLLPDFNTGKATDIIGSLAMKHAIAVENTDIAEAVVRKGLNINSDMSLIYKAMDLVDIEGVHKFLARNGMISDGKTPLFWAAEQDSVIMVRCLIDLGADPTVRDNAGNQPISYARKYETVRLLKDAQKKFSEEAEKKKAQ